MYDSKTGSIGLHVAFGEEGSVRRCCFATFNTNHNSNNPQTTC